MCKGNTGLAREKYPIITNTETYNKMILVTTEPESLLPLSVVLENDADPNV